MTSARPRIFFLSKISLLLFLLSSIAASAAEPRKAGPAGATRSRLAWALAPGVFERLSPGARQAVLVANSLAPAPVRRDGPAAPRAAAAAALAAPAPRAERPRERPGSRRRSSREPHDVRRRARLARLRRLRGRDLYGSRLRGLERRRRDVRAHADPDARRRLRLGKPVGRDRPVRRDLLRVPHSGERGPDRASRSRSPRTAASRSPRSRARPPTSQNGYDVMDKPAIAVDNGASSPRKGSVYVAWTYYFRNLGYTAILCARSSDGVTFQPPAQSQRDRRRPGGSRGRGRRTERRRVRRVPGRALLAGRNLDHALDRRRPVLRRAAHGRDVPAGGPRDGGRRRRRVELRPLARRGRKRRRPRRLGGRLAGGDDGSFGRLLRALDGQRIDVLGGPQAQRRRHAHDAGLPVGRGAAGRNRRRALGRPPERRGPRHADRRLHGDLARRRRDVGKELPALGPQLPVGAGAAQPLRLPATRRTTVSRPTAGPSTPRGRTNAPATRTCGRPRSPRRSTRTRPTSTSRRSRRTRPPRRGGPRRSTSPRRASTASPGRSPSPRISRRPASAFRSRATRRRPARPCVSRSPCRPRRRPATTCSASWRRPAASSAGRACVSR